MTLLILPALVGAIASAVILNNSLRFSLTIIRVVRAGLATVAILVAVVNVAIAFVVAFTALTRATAAVLMLTHLA